MTEGSPDLNLLRIDDRDFIKFRKIIQERSGILLRDGKQVMLASRLTRRLRHHGLTTFSEYYALLTEPQNGPAEMIECINCVTTNKTSFFREPHHFDFLAQTLLPQALRTASAREIRIWSAACSTGEEPYSIAITLLEALRRYGSRSEVKVFASDVDTTVLATAQQGVYPAESLESVETSVQGRYFLRGKAEASGQIKIKPELGRAVEFKRINLMQPTWPVEGLFHAIFFRNALIYFDQPTQELFLRKMLRHLRPQGYLFLGHSEHVPWLQDVLEPLSHTTYRLRLSSVAPQQATG